MVSNQQGNKGSQEHRRQRCSRGAAGVWYTYGRQGTVRYAWGQTRVCASGREGGEGQQADTRTRNQTGNQGSGQVMLAGQWGCTTQAHKQRVASNVYDTQGHMDGKKEHAYGPRRHKAGRKQCQHLETQPKPNQGFGVLKGTKITTPGDSQTVPHIATQGSTAKQQGNTATMASRGQG